ncbi:DUF6838 family protein [Agathobaculum sp. Marseille-P7918]|uniref:phage tail terminator family protein n=1 Tax=Agathobaculum sp. Marseille-P7918 TaxID=2479843 RepID=UPI003569D76D
MKIRDIRGALAAFVLPLVQGAEVMRPDDKKPLKRPSFKIDVLPVSGGPACDGAREYEADIDIWYYPKSGDRPRDECDTVAEQLLDTLGEGFAVGGIWLPLDEDITIDTSQGVLVAQFGISWVETAAETGEYMETLNYNGEELTT